MFKNILVLGTFLALSLLAAQVNACMDHYYYEPTGNGSFFNSSRASSRIMSPTAKVFKVKHVPATVVVIDEDSDFKIDYDLPPTSKNVSLQLVAGGNVELLDNDIQLKDLNGTATARFRVTQKGIDTITVTVRGEHEGEVLSYSSTMYINAKPATPS